MRCLLVTSFSRDLETQVQEMNFYRNLQGPPVRAGMQPRFLWVGCPPRGKSSVVPFGLLVEDQHSFSIDPVL